MKVIFIRSGNQGIDPISQNQGESLINEGINIIYFNIIGRGVKGYLRNIKTLRAVIKKNNPDILHAHYSFCGFVASLTFSKIPIIVSLMGSDVNNPSKIEKFAISFFIKYFWKKIIVKSIQMKNMLRWKQAIVIPNGVDLNRYKPLDKKMCLDRLGWDSNTKHLLFASDPSRPEKNYILAKNAIEKLNDKNLDIHYLMKIKQNEIVYYYNAADSLLLTSLYEGSPNVIKEAMACNCPVVSTNVGDVEKLIQDIPGCFITSFDSEDVARDIHRALMFNGKTNARNKLNNLSSEIIAQKLISIYNELI
jgi:teichuronic acid biosynthesis glycosyltransferase TuaC